MCVHAIGAVIRQLMSGPLSTSALEYAVVNENLGRHAATAACVHEDNTHSWSAEIDGLLDRFALPPLVEFLLDV